MKDPPPPRRSAQGRVRQLMGHTSFARAHLSSVATNTGGGNVGYVRTLEWQNLVRRHFGTNS